MRVNRTYRIHQDNLKAEIYHQFKVNDFGLEILLEYSVPRLGFENKRKNCRFDAVVLYKEDIIAIIEVRSLNIETSVNYFSHKSLKYQQYGLPVYYISKYEEIPNLITKCLKLKRHKQLQKYYRNAG